MTLSNLNLTALSQNATRLTMRLQESISEHTREFGLQGFGVRGVGADLGTSDLSEEKNGIIKKQLESGSDREKLDAMRKLVALIPKHPTQSPHFPSVVKLVASPSLEIRKLVYIYLLQYSAYHPDLALLSINTFQRDLGDASPVMRGMAMRVLSGMAVGVSGGRGREGSSGGGGIGPLVRLAVGKCVKDGNVYVRKVGVLALVRCYELDPTHPSSIQTLSSTLLADRSPQVLGASLFAFTRICPTRLDLIHKHFRRLCRLLIEMDEWGQVLCMGVLLRYARVMLPRPIHNEDGEEGELDKDLKLLLESVKPALQSRNPAVVVAATRVLYCAGPPSYWSLFVSHLLRLLTVSREVERVTLADLLIITRKDPHIFTFHYTRFLVRSDDLPQVKEDKIQLLLNVVDGENWPAIMRELIDYSDDVDEAVVAKSIKGIGSCAMKLPECMGQCLTALITMIKSRYDVVVSNAVMVLKRLVQIQLASQHWYITASPPSHSPLEIVAHLARRIDDIKHPQARACVIWLVGQYASTDPSMNTRIEGIADWAPDVLRKFATSFSSEASLVKLQVITLASKLIVLCPDDVKIGMMARYVFAQARYDRDWDIRDRGRMVSGLLGGLKGPGVDAMLGSVEKREERVGVVLRREQVRVVLFEGKEVRRLGGQFDDEEGGEDRGGIGSFGRVIGRGGGMHLSEEILPDWMEKGVEGSLRDSEEDKIPIPLPITAFGSSGKGVVMPQHGQGQVVLVPTSTSTSAGGSTATPVGTGPRMDLDAFYADSKVVEEESEDEDENDEENEDDEGEGYSDEEEDNEEEDEDEDGDEEERDEGYDKTLQRFD